MGIYAIRIPASGALRVLASRNVPAAINRTRFELQRGASRDRMLQQAWNAGGEAAVRFETLELVRERDEAAFDYAAELQVLLELWTAELAGSAP
jgi:hypothetical protein